MSETQLKNKLETLYNELNRDSKGELLVNSQNLENMANQIHILLQIIMNKNV